MSNYLLSAISCLCLLHADASAEECIQGVFAKRNTLYVPEGGSLSLSCEVEHCGKDTWTSDWIWTNSTHEEQRPVNESARHQLTNNWLSANRTKLILNFLQASQLDEGSYGCKVIWGQGETEQGHWIYVNVTAAVPSHRSVLHRFLVCACAFLCLPVILGLARCLSSEVKPQPLPRTLSSPPVMYQPVPQPPPRCPIPQKRSTSPHKAASKSKLQQKTQVVYADISQAALKQQGAIREPTQSTVYSSVRFS